MLQHSSSSYARVFVLLTVCSFVFASLLSITIRLSCSPTVPVKSGTIGTRFTGIAVWPRFVVQALRALLPAYHAFAAILYSYALVFKRRTRVELDEQPPSCHQCQTTIDFSSASGWKQFVLEVGRDARDAAVRVCKHFKQPAYTGRSVEDSELSAPLHDSSETAAVVHSRLTTFLLSIANFIRCLVVSPFYFSRWFVTPLSFRSIFYRLALRTFLIAAVYGLPLTIERAYGPQAYYDRIGEWLGELGLDDALAKGVSTGWPSFFLIQEALLKWIDLLLLAVWCRASKVNVRQEELSIGSRRRRLRQQVNQVNEADEESDNVEQTEQPQHDTPGADEISEEPHVSEDDSSMSLSARVQSHLKSVLARCPSVLWLWMTFYLTALLLPALYNLYITLEWNRIFTRAYWAWFDPQHKFILYATLLPTLFIEHCLHVRGPEHAKAFPESTIPWYQQSQPSEHDCSHSHSDECVHDCCPRGARPMCSCLLVRLFVLAMVASWAFNDMLGVLRNEYGAVNGDTAQWSYFDIGWRVVSFYATVMMWKLIVRWVALGPLQGAASIVPVFAIQLVEDVWSFLFFTSCDPFSPAFLFVCGLHFIKTLGRDLNVPYWTACFLADRLNKLAVRQWGSIVAGRLPLSCMPSPGWRLTRNRSLMRHQNFLSFTCAKLIVLACFVADLLPSSIGSYGVTPELSQEQRGWKIMAIVWVVTQQALSHWTVLRLITWLSNREREVASAKQVNTDSSDINDAATAHGSSISSSSLVTVLREEEEKTNTDSRLARPVPMTSPTIRDRHQALLTLSELVDVHWRYHFLFFAVSVFRVSFETTRYAAAAAHMPPAAFPDMRCIST